MFNLSLHSCVWITRVGRLKTFVKMSIILHQLQIVIAPFSLWLSRCSSNTSLLFPFIHPPNQKKLNTLGNILLLHPVLFAVTLPGSQTLNDCDELLTTVSFMQRCNDQWSKHRYQATSYHKLLLDLFKVDVRSPQVFCY